MILIPSLIKIHIFERMTKTGFHSQHVTVVPEVQKKAPPLNVTQFENTSNEPLYEAMASLMCVLTPFHPLAECSRRLT
jgi:hypothetical protein